jgi:alkanesulfonate monooxygenase SsuD/methylene tetrahydromethanopterin reductase-like flavin-dependent oxidoreductase (luciferase family)
MERSPHRRGATGATESVDSAVAVPRTEVVHPRAMRFGVSIPNVGSAVDLVRLAVDAESAGWDGVFLWDHMHLRRDLRLDVFDPWVVLGAMAVQTERVRLGTLVTPLARRRPWKVAKEVMTLDHLTNGRAVLGVGLGEPGDDEFAAFGDPSDPRERAEILDDALAVIDRVWTGEPFRHEGPVFTIEAELKPSPVQRPRPPVWVAGVLPRRRPFERAARWDGVVPLSPSIAFMQPDEVAQVLAITGSRPGFDVVVAQDPAVGVKEYEDAGATWLTTSRWPDDGWYDDLRAEILEGPPAS